MTERFTLRREAKWIGVICGLIGLGLLAATALGVTWGCNFASPEKQRQATLAVCVGALFILVVGLWEFALAIRTAVITGGRSLFVRSLFSRQTIAWHEISRASWSMRFLGLTLHWPGGHRKVHLAHDGNPRSGRMQHLLRILRTRIDVDVQEGWNEHYERILNPRVITRAEHDATIRSMYRGVLLWGIPGGVVGGMVFAVGLAAVVKVPASAFRELAIKGALYGLVAAAALLILIALADRFGRPGEPPAND